MRTATREQILARVAPLIAELAAGHAWLNARLDALPAGGGDAAEALALVEECGRRLAQLRRLERLALAARPGEVFRTDTDEGEVSHGG